MKKIFNFTYAVATAMLALLLLVGTSLNLNAAGPQPVNIFGITQSASQYVTARFTDGTNFLGGSATLPIAVRLTDGTSFVGTTDGTVGQDVLTTGPHPLLQAIADLTGLTLQANGKGVIQAADGMGRSMSIPGCDRSSRLHEVVTTTDGTSTAASSGFGAHGSGNYNEVWAVAFANTSASADLVDIRDGSAGSVLGTFPVPGNSAGAVLALPVPLTSSANTAIAVDSHAATDSIVVTLIGCKAK